MSITRRATFRLYPSKTQNEKLHYWRKLHKLLYYPCKAGWKACSSGKNGYLKLSNLGNIQMRGQARDWGIAKTCTILFKQGKWYASITVDCVPVRPQTDTGALGLDFGYLIQNNSTKQQQQRLYFFLLCKYSSIQNLIYTAI
jgi:hypothetical protein